MDSGNGSEPTNPAPPQPQPLGYEMRGQVLDLPFPDQRGGMKTMGVVLIVLGAFSGCLAVFTPPMAMLATKMPGVPRASVRDLLAGLAIYLLAAALLITVGAASLRIKRWSRPAALIITGTWALTGLFGFISYLLFAPGMDEAVAAMNAQAAAASSATTLPAGAAAATMPTVALSPTFTRSFGLVTGCFMLVFLIVLPAGFFWFYKRPSVQQTLDYFDPGPAWTDRCPTPVLGMSFWLLLGALTMLGFCFWGVIPAFGLLLTGPAAVAIAVALAMLLAALAVAAYRVRPAAWWATLLLVVLGITSALVTFSRVDPLDMYRLSGAPPEQIDLMQRMGAARRGPMIGTQVMYGTALIGYLLWVRKFFQPGRTP